MTLHCLVGPNWVVTLHKGELDLVDEFNKPLNGDTRIGDLNGPAFLSLVLDWQISGYFGVIESLQTEIDELDEELLARSPDKNDLLDRLQALRTRVRKLRNTLSSHREVLGLLSHPRSDALIGAEAVEDYKRLEDRLQQAIDTVDTTREMIVGSFDIFMTRTAQTTNDIMKRLTIVSVLLLPAAALAGIMGMNFKVEIFEWPWMFWVTIGLMLAVAGVTLCCRQTAAMALRVKPSESQTKWCEPNISRLLRGTRLTEPGSSCTGASDLFRPGGAPWGIDFPPEMGFPVARLIQRRQPLLPGSNICQTSFLGAFVPDSDSGNDASPNPVRGGH